MCEVGTAKGAVCGIRAPGGGLLGGAYDWGAFIGAFMGAFVGAFVGGVYDCD